MREKKNEQQERRSEKNDTFEKDDTFEKTNDTFEIDETFDEKDEIIRNRFKKANKKLLRQRRFSIIKKHDKEFENENNNRCANIIFNT